MFILPFKAGENNPTRNYFDKYYMSLVEIKDFNTLIDNKLFFDQHINSEQGAYEKLVKISWDNNHTTENLLEYLYHQNYYKLRFRDLSRQTNTTIPQQINFTEKLEEDNSAITFFITEK